MRALMRRISTPRVFTGRQKLLLTALIAEAVNHNLRATDGIAVLVLHLARNDGLGSHRNRQAGEMSAFHKIKRQTRSVRRSRTIELLHIPETVSEKRIAAGVDVLE